MLCWILLHSRSHLWACLRMLPRSGQTKEALTRNPTFGTADNALQLSNGGRSRVSDILNDRFPSMSWLDKAKKTNGKTLLLMGNPLLVGIGKEIL